MRVNPGCEVAEVTTPPVGLTSGVVHVPPVRRRSRESKEARGKYTKQVLERLEEETRRLEDGLGHL